MGTFRIIDTLLEQMLQEDDLVTNKVSGATYIVKRVNPVKHELVKPNLSHKDIQDFESGRQKARAAQGKKELKANKKADPAAVASVKKIRVPKDIGPESPEQAIGTKPKAEKRLATRMAQLGKASADYLTAVKAAATELKQKNPNMSDEELQDAAKAEVKKRGVPKPPSYDLCAVSIPGTNLFCSGNKEIPRDNMPQLKTKAVPGTPAWKKAEEEAKKKGIDPKDVEINAENAFLEYLGKQGVEVTRGESMPATEMKATQNQLNADKVAGMAWALYSNEATKDPKHPLRQPLIVSNDGYVLDGHHRWAALATYDVMRGEKTPTDVPVIKINMDIEELVDASNAFGDEYGLERKGMGASAEGAGKSGEQPLAKSAKTTPTPTHKIKKSDLKAHQDWMDSEGYDTNVVPLPADDPDAKDYVGIVSKNGAESAYHADGFAEPYEPKKKPAEKKPLAAGRTYGHTNYLWV